MGIPYNYKHYNKTTNLHIQMDLSFNINLREKHADFVNLFAKLQIILNMGPNAQTEKSLKSQWGYLVNLEWGWGGATFFSKGWFIIVEPQSHFSPISANSLTIGTLVLIVTKLRITSILLLIPECAAADIIYIYIYNRRQKMTLSHRYVLVCVVM